MRCRSAHSATVCAGSGARPLAQATAISSAASKLAKFNFDLRHFRQMATQVAHQHLFHGMGLGPSSAAMSAATRGGQFSQASRSRRARSNTNAVAQARSTTSPFIFCNRTPGSLRPPRGCRGQAADRRSACHDRGCLRRSGPRQAIRGDNRVLPADLHRRRAPHRLGNRPAPEWPHLAVARIDPWHQRPPDLGPRPYGTYRPGDRQPGRRCRRAGGSRPS